MSEHDVVQELLGAYALDAVDPEERARVEAHLPSCQWCRAEVAEHHEVAGLLARIDGVAPPHLWDRIESAVEGNAEGAMPPPPFPSLGERSRRSRQALAPWVAAAAAVLAIVSMSVVLLDDGDGGAGRDAPITLAEAANRAVADPDALRAELRALTGDVLAYAVVLPSGDGYLMPSGLPALDAGVYQLWGRGGDTVVSLGVFDGSAGVVAFHSAPALDEIMVTHEDAPVAQTANIPVVRGDVA